MEKPDEFVVSFTILDPKADWMQCLLIYQRLVDTKSMASLYWEVPGAEHASFPEWITPYMGGNRYLVKVNYGDEFAGVILLYDVCDLHRAMMGIWMEPSWRGHKTEVMGKKFLVWLHAHLKLENIYCWTPWNAAKELAIRSGMESVTIVPNYCKYKDRPLDVEMFHSDRESCKLGQIRKHMSMGWGEKSARDMIDRIFGET